MGVFLRDGRYHYKRMIGGRRYYRALGIKKGQEPMLSARIKQVDDELTALAYGLPMPGKDITLAGYREIYLRHKAHKKSLDRDKQRLIYMADALPDIPLRQLRAQHFEDLEAVLEADGKGRTTINRYLELARHTLNMAIRDGILTTNPLNAWEPYIEDGTRRALSDDDIRAVFVVLPAIEDDRRFGPVRRVVRDVIIFALATGMRLSEILNLRRSDIRGDIITLPISSTKSRRRGVSKQRVKVITLNALAVAAAKRQPETPDGYVFAVGRRHPNVMFYVSKKIREAEAGVPGFTFHCLRHTASTILASHASLAAAKTALGHADIKTTLRYTHPGLEEQRASVAKLGEHLAEIVVSNSKQ